MINLIFSIFKSLNKLNFYINFFIYFLTYMKMSKDSSAKYYEDNKEKLQKKALERYQSLSKEEKEKKTIWLWTIQSTYQKIKNKEKLQNQETQFTIPTIGYKKFFAFSSNCKKLILFKKFGLFGQT